MREEEPLDSIDLDVEQTRPHLLLFVPYELALWFFIAFFVLDTQFHSWKLGFVVIPFWAAAAVQVRKDFNGVRVLNVRLRLLNTKFGAWRWGGTSLSPFSVRRGRGML